jgi:hypothetical protein
MYLNFDSPLQMTKISTFYFALPFVAGITDRVCIMIMIKGLHANEQIGGFHFFKEQKTN